MQVHSIPFPVPPYSLIRTAQAAETAAAINEATTDNFRPNLQSKDLDVRESFDNLNYKCLTLSLLSSKSTFSQPFEEEKYE